MKSPARPLGRLTLLALGINGIVGVGIFVAPPIVAGAFPGAMGAFVYLAVAIACLPVAIAYARLARALPHDGGPMLYAERAFGPLAARSIGALVWVSAVFSTAAVTRALAERLAVMVGSARLTAPIAIAIVLVLALVNVRGLQLSAWAWTAFTGLKLVPLVLIAIIGLLVAKGTEHAPMAVTGARRGAALLSILFALQGFEIVPLPAGQADDAARTVPRATIASLLFAGLLYAAVHFACVRALPSLALESSPIPAAAAVLGGHALSRAIAFGVFASIAGIVIGMHAMTPRYLASIGQTRKREDVDPIVVESSAPPLRAIVVSGTIAAALSSLSSLPELLNLASVAVLTQYGLTALALVVLARRGEEGLAHRDAWPAPLALVVVLVLLAQARLRELLLAAVVALAGIVVARAVER